MVIVSLCLFEQYINESMACQGGRFLFPCFRTSPLSSYQMFKRSFLYFDEIKYL